MEFNHVLASHIMILLILGGQQVTSAPAISATPDVEAFGGDIPENETAFCHFPFDYWGKTYYRCTCAHEDRPWCYVDEEFDKWGYCDVPYPCIRAKGGDVGMFETAYCSFPFEDEGVHYEDRCSCNGKDKPWCYIDEAGERWGTCQVDYECVEASGGELDDGEIALCSFPFTFLGENYTRCSCAHNDQPWCYVDAARDTWANCNVEYGCVTASGGDLSDGVRKYCYFPFEYRGETYNKCSCRDHGEPWCYISGDFDEWAICDVDYPCVSISGGDVEDSNTYCSFPFHYAGVRYEDRCTCVDKRNPWCIFDTETGEWGFCDVEYECVTASGGDLAEDASSTCSFPFSYFGREYTRCTCAHHDRPWCYVDPDGDQWANCDVQFGCVMASDGEIPAYKTEYCYFPFEYRGDTYNDCSCRDHEKPWCYVDKEFDTWGVCHVEYDCIAASGGDVGILEEAYCAFPFVHEGVRYNDRCSCDNKIRPWCQIDKVTREWGFCHVDYECIEASGGDLDDGETRTCSFPFTYLGQKITSCTCLHHDKPWCYVDAQGDTWAECNVEYECVIASDGELEQDRTEYCFFPFDYLGEEYNRCTCRHHHEPWCYVDKEMETWGVCRVDYPCVSADGGDLGFFEEAFCSFPFRHAGVLYEDRCSCANDTDPWCYVDDRGERVGHCDVPYKCVTAFGGELDDDTNSTCSFPFYYFGHQYTSCTCDHNDGPWCYVDASRRTWAYCDTSLSCEELADINFPKEDTTTEGVATTVEETTEGATTTVEEASTTEAINPPPINIPNEGEEGTTVQEVTTMEEESTSTAEETTTMQEITTQETTTTAEVTTTLEETTTVNPTTEEVTTAEEATITVKATGGDLEEGEVATCHFPFTYWGKEYTECTCDGHNKYWCYVDADNERWGNCMISAECP